MSTATQREAKPGALPSIAFNRQLLVEAGEVPDRVPLIPAGPKVIGRDGRAWLFDDLAANAVLASFQQDGVDLPIDWEHSTQHRAPNGSQAPAAAWITGLNVDGGQLIAAVKWTDRGKASVAGREYRYLSPVFDFDPKTGRILRLVSAGLVNRPNLELPAINQAINAQGALSADEIAICKATGTDPEAFKAARAAVLADRAANEAERPTTNVDERRICALTGVSPEAYAQQIATNQRNPT